MLKVVSSYSEAEFLVEIIYTRTLDLLGLGEREEDFTSFLAAERPTQADMEALVPSGWQLVEARLTAVDWDDETGYDSDESPDYDPDNWDLNLELEDAGAY